MECRYRDKTYLAGYILDTKLFDKFDFLVEDAAPIRSAYILTTNCGFKILKKIDYGLDELMFIYSALKVIREKYPYVISFRQSADNMPYVRIGEDIYTVLDMIEGRDCVFENPLDLSAASAALAKLHEAGKSINTENQSRNNIYKMPERYNRKIAEMKKFKEIALMHKNKSDFDVLYIKYCDYYIECAQKALCELEASPYLKLCGEHHTLCHHDLAHHNILIDDNSNVHFIDFDYALVDCPYHDISNLITKAIKHNEWAVDTAQIVVDAYSSVRELDNSEMKVLYSYLLFPQDFYDISTFYYQRSRDWDEDEFVDKLIRKSEYKQSREKFLEDFKDRWVNQ